MIYPALPAPLDLGLLRLNGAGFGNCLFAYFHAVILAEKEGRRLIAPAWRSLPINRKLRGDGSIRRYHDMVRTHPDEVGGPAKAAALAALLPFADIQAIAPGALPHGSKHPLIVVRSACFTFEGLHPHRDRLRHRLLEIMRHPPKLSPLWGGDRCIAVHVRLGDFDPADPALLESGETGNLRLPIAWYGSVIARLRALRPDLPIRIHSDGADDELTNLLAMEGVTRARSSDDINDLVAMASASVLVGSHSTFSRWAAFLGNMPVIWRAQRTASESPVDPRVRSQHIGDDMSVLEDPLE
ncbi:MAG: hypothetical protein ABIS51_17925 [Sphingomonas sp.]